MKMRFYCVSTAIIAIVVSVGSGFAQTAPSKFLISAKAGGVNEVVGDVTVERDGGRVGRLFKGDEVQIGERVSTGTDGKAEILMNPGSYIRLGPSSSFEFVSTDLDDVRIKVRSGSAIFEVFGAEDFKVSVNAGASNFTLLETGIYRLDVAANGIASLSVWKGKVRGGEGAKAVQGGRRVEFTGSEYMVAKFDRDAKDELTLWSSDRAKTLSRVSASLRPDQLRDPLISSFWGRSWNLYNSYGLWVYDPSFRSFCFLPFGFGWYSPYGYGFGRPIWYYNLPVAIYNQPAPPGSSNPRVPVEPSPRTRPDIKGDPSGRGIRNDDARDVRVKEPSRPVIVDQPRISIPRAEPVVVNEPAVRTRKP